VLLAATKMMGRLEERWIVIDCLFCSFVKTKIRDTNAAYWLMWLAFIFSLSQKISLA